MNHFTPGAKRVFGFAREEAESFHHNFIGTEHLLLGIIKLGQGVAANVLKFSGLNLENVRKEVERQVGLGCDPGGGDIQLTPRVMKVLSIAHLEARTLRHTFVGTEHILLGLVRESDSPAARVLKSLKVDLEQTRQMILNGLDPNSLPDDNKLN
ncbi:MAG: Clp protease N-terminal domain-containing protein [Verrucomicrobiota bacterium]